MEEDWKVYHKSSEKCPKHLQVIYEVSNKSNVKRNGILIKPRTDNNNYYTFGNGYFIHRAVAELFITNSENKNCVDHIDGDKHNNNVNNLRWVTHKENNNNPITKEKLKCKHKMPKTWYTNMKIAHQGTNKGSENPAYSRKWMVKGNDRVYPKPNEFCKYLDLGYHFGYKYDTI